MPVFDSVPWIAIAVLAAVATIAWSLVRIRRNKHRQRSSQKIDEWRRGGRYWGVRISPGSNSEGCQAVQRMSGHVFPVTTSPALPLPACDRRNCKCDYLPYPERRHQERRIEPRREAVRFEQDRPDRRQCKDRRAAIRSWNKRHS